MMTKWWHGLCEDWWEYEEHNIGRCISKDNHITIAPTFLVTGHGVPGAPNSGLWEPGAPFLAMLSQLESSMVMENQINSGHWVPISPNSVLGHGEPGIDEGVPMCV